MTRLELQVCGLHCSGCERSLESAVRRLDGVVRAKAAAADAGELTLEVTATVVNMPMVNWPGGNR